MPIFTQKNIKGFSESRKYGTHKDPTPLGWHLHIYNKPLMRISAFIRGIYFIDFSNSVAMAK
jgi:hypothetical protein